MQRHARHSVPRFLRLLLAAFILCTFVPRSAFATSCPNKTSHISVNTNSLDFGSVVLDASSTKTFNITYTNCSNITAVYLLMNSSSSFFELGLLANYYLGAGKTVTVPVTFTPTRAAGEKTYTGSVTVQSVISSNFHAPVGPAQTINLIGIGYLPKPNISVSPTGIDFGSANVGTSKNGSFQISNSGDAALTGSLSANSAFSVSPGSFNIGPGGNQSFTVTFSPSSESTFNGTVSINSNDPDTPNTGVSLVGVGYQPKARIDINPTGFDFGSVQVNTQALQTLVIRNVGDATLSGSISTSSPFGAPPGNFSVGPGGSQSFNISFTPGTRQDYSGQLTISTNAANANNLGVGLQGKGIAPYLSVSPSSNAFGSVPVGESRPVTITISNGSGNYSNTLNLSSFQMNGGEFSFSGPGSTSLAPGASTTLQVSFNPASTGSKNGTLTFSTNDPWNSSVSVSLGGTGVTPSINPSTLNISYGDIHLSTSGTYTLNLANTGTLALNIFGFSKPAAVSVSPGSTSIAPGNSQNFTVTFSPTWESTLSGDLIVQSNDLKLPSLAIALSGKGVTPRIGTESLIDFQNVFINPNDASSAGTLDLKLEVSNNGQETLSISDVQSNHSAFVPLTKVLSVPPGGKDVLSVRYKPTALGNQGGTLSIRSNDYFTTTKTVSLTGTGVSYLDLRISQVEVTQAIQKTDNSLSLIAGKPTAVRAFIDMSLWGDSGQKDIVKNVDGLLHILKNGQEIPGSPIAPLNGPFDAVPNPDRRSARETLNFLIPASLTDCGSCDVQTLVLQVEINPASGGRITRIVENNFANNDYGTIFTFWKNYRPTIYYIPLSIYQPSTGKRYPLPPISLMNEGTNLLKKLFPTSGIEYIRRPPLAFNEDVTWSTYDKLLRLLFFASHLSGTPPDRTYGWFPVDYYAQGFGGVAEDIPGRVAMGGGLSYLPSAQDTFAHEIGHTYGLCHTQFPVSYHCPSGYTDNHVVEDGAVTEVGFDTEKSETLPPLSVSEWLSCLEDGSKCTGNGSIDFMSWPKGGYRRWIHPQRHQFLFSRLRSQKADPSNPRGCGNLTPCPPSEPVLLIAGSIREEGTAEIHPLYASESIPDPLPQEATEPTPYAVRLLDKEGKVLLEYPLDVSFGKGGHVETDEKEFNFSVVTPDNEEIETIEILKEGSVIASRSKSNHPPKIKLLSPQGGESVQGVLRVQWEGSDEDQDKLLYSILYSADGGKAFEAIGVDLNQTSFEYDASKVGGSEEAVVRVVATDGFNTTTVDSASFKVTSKPPELVILSPKNGETIFEGTLISLAADATDPEEGNLSSKSVHWESDLAGKLGEGNPLDLILPLGSHTITATVTDRDGNKASQKIQVFVVDGAKAPRASAGPDQNVDEGQTVVLDASETSDPNEGDTLTYEWKQLDGPNVPLDDPMGLQPSFKAPKVDVNTLLKFLVTVTDQTGNVATDTVDIAVLNAYYPLLKLSLEEIDFGTVTLGSASSKKFMITNEGNEPLEVTSIDASRPVFKAVPSQATLEAGGSAEITVTFTPDEAATYEGLLKVISNTAGGRKTMIVLKGTSPEPQVIHDDTGVGGSLPPQLATPQPDQMKTPSPDESNKTDPQPGPSDDLGTPSGTVNPETETPPVNGPVSEGDGISDEAERGSFGFVGIGGCSLIR